MSDSTQTGTTKPLTRIEEKRRRIYFERRQRAINKGVPVEQVDAVLAREDFERLPLEERVHHMVDAAFRKLAEEMVALQYNDQLLSAAMDVNFRAMAKMLEKLGLPRDQQLTLLAEAKEDIEKEQKGREEAAAAATAAAEATAMKDATEKAGEPLPPPEEATIFGG